MAPIGSRLYSFANRCSNTLWTIVTIPPATEWEVSESSRAFMCLDPTPQLEHGKVAFVLSVSPEPASIFKLNQVGRRAEDAREPTAFASSPKRERFVHSLKPTTNNESLLRFTTSLRSKPFPNLHQNPRFLSSSLSSHILLRYSSQILSLYFPIMLRLAAEKL